MNRTIRTAAVLAAMLCFGTQTADAAGMDASWNNGIRLATSDGSTKIKLGGRLQNDWGFQTGDDELLAALGTGLPDGTEFRRLRLYFSGTVHHVTIFKAQFDFAGGSAKVKDMYVGLKKLPGLGTVIVGHTYEPFGLETQTSSKYITFLERSLTGAFAPERKSGIQATNHTENVTWEAGVFRDTDDFGFRQADGEYNATGRVALHFLQDGGRKLVHVGVAGSFRNPTGDEVRYRSRAENHFGPRYVDTGTLAADRVVLIGLEGAVVEGPFSLQSEYVQSNVSTIDNRDPRFNAFYVAGSFFLTGEHRPYSTSGAVFSRVKPNDPYDGKGSPGAWEIAARYSRADLADAMVDGGQLEDITGALNWYPNPNFRWMMNYVRADLENAGVSHSLITRFAADF